MKPHEQVLTEVVSENCRTLTNGIQNAIEEYCYKNTFALEELSEDEVRRLAVSFFANELIKRSAELAHNQLWQKLNA